MKFHVLTLFPEMVEQGIKTSITGKAIENKTISVDAVNIRDYTQDKHKKADDYTYGGGAGMLMQAQPVYDAYLSVTGSMAETNKPRVIYVTPQGQLFHQGMAESLAKEKELIFLCGHYEGVDERVLEEIVTDYVSIGDYVLTGGELPAMVMMDAIARLVPEVLHNEESAHIETFHNHLLEYPQYSRPEVWHEKRVPEVLLSGNHQKIREWRLEQSVNRTRERRPDLYQEYERINRVIVRLIQKDKLLYMDMIEPLKRGAAEILYEGAEGVLLKETVGGAWMLMAEQEQDGEKILNDFSGTEKPELFTSHQDFMDEAIQRILGLVQMSCCVQAVYTRGVALPERKDIQIRQLDLSYAQMIHEHYAVVDDIEYVRERILSKVFYGAFLDGELAGFCGIHTEGSMGMLEVFEQYRRRGIAQAMESACINRQLQAGTIPFCQIFQENEASIRLQQKLGLRLCSGRVWWYKKGK